MGGDWADHPRSLGRGGPGKAARSATVRSAVTVNRNVMVIHGRNLRGVAALFDFLRSLDLRPIGWNEAVRTTGHGAPYALEAVRSAMASAQAAVVLLSPDDLAYLNPGLVRHDEALEAPAGQPRPNVFIELGLALASKPDKTILVHLGRIRPISDLAGLQYVRLPEERGGLRERLISAGCQIDKDSTAWTDTGDFTDALRGLPLVNGHGLPAALHHAVVSLLVDCSLYRTNQQYEFHIREVHHPTLEADLSLTYDLVNHTDTPQAATLRLTPIRPTTALSAAIDGTSVDLGSPEVFHTARGLEVVRRFGPRTTHRVELAGRVTYSASDNETFGSFLPALGLKLVLSHPPEISMRYERMLMGEIEDKRLADGSREFVVQQPVLPFHGIKLDWVFSGV